MPECAWDNDAYAFSGDLCKNMITTVNVAPGIFDEVDRSPVRVAGDVMLEEELGGEGEVQHVGPYG